MQTEGAAAFRAAAEALKEADKAARREVYAAFRKAARPLGVSVIRGGASEMPKRGGFAEQIARAKMTQSNAASGRNPGVSLSFKTKPSHNLKALDAGILRHKTFGHEPWKEQKVPEGAFTRPFEAGADPVRREILAALESVAHEIARATGR